MQDLAVAVGGDYAGGAPPPGDVERGTEPVGMPGSDLASPSIGYVMSISAQDGRLEFDTYRDAGVSSAP